MSRWQAFRKRVATKEFAADSVMVMMVVVTLLAALDLAVYNGEYSYLLEQQRRLESSKEYLDSMGYRFGNALLANEKGDAPRAVSVAARRFREGAKKSAEVSVLPWHGSILRLKEDLLAANRLGLRQALIYRRAVDAGETPEAIYRELRRIRDKGSAFTDSYVVVSKRLLDASR